MGREYDLLLNNGWRLHVVESRIAEDFCQLIDPNDCVLMEGHMMEPKEAAEELIGNGDMIANEIIRMQQAMNDELPYDSLTEVRRFTCSWATKLRNKKGMGNDGTYMRGQWAAFDEVLNFINTVDSSLFGSLKEFRKHLYQKILEMKPKPE